MTVIASERAKLGYGLGTEEGEAFYLLGMISLPITTGASSFFVYSAAFLPFVVASVPIIVTIFVVQALSLLAEGLLLHVHLIALLLTSFLMLVVGASNTFIARQKRADTKLRMANEEIEQLAAVAERERIFIRAAQPHMVTTDFSTTTSDVCPSAAWPPESSSAKNMWTLDREPPGCPLWR